MKLLTARLEHGRLERVNRLQQLRQLVDVGAGGRWLGVLRFQLTVETIRSIRLTITVYTRIQVHLHVIRVRLLERIDQLARQLIVLDGQQIVRLLGDARMEEQRLVQRRDGGGLAERQFAEHWTPQQCSTRESGQLESGVFVCMLCSSFFRALYTYDRTAR